MKGRTPPHSSCAAREGKDAAGEVVGLEHLFHRFQVELGRQVVDRQVFLVEGPDQFGPGHVAVHQVLVQVAELLLVPLKVHAHEGAELHEAGIDRNSAAYCKRIMELPSMKEWIAAAKQEPEEIDELDAEF